MNDEPQDDGFLQHREHSVQKHWFNKLPESDQADIIKPAFEAAHPSNADKRRATKEYEATAKAP